MRDLAFFLLLFGSIPFIFRRPFIGVLLWCWISYMLPHRMMWGFMYTFPVAQMVAIVTLAAYALSKEPKTIAFEGPIKWLIAFYFMMFLSWLFHDKTPFVNMLAIKVIKVQFFTLIILAMLTTRKRIEAALWVIALSIGYYGVKGGFFTLVTAGEYRVWGPPDGFFGENNAMAVTNLMIAPIFLYLSTTVNSKWAKWALIGCAGLTTIAVFGSHSRGALLSLLAAAFFFWLRSKRKLLPAVAVLLAFPVMVSFMPEHWHDRMATIFIDEEAGEVRESSSASRLNAWQAGFNMSISHPFAGGFNAENPRNWLIYAPNPHDFVAFHSNYFQVLGKHGWLALICFLMVFYSSWRLANRVIKSVQDEPSLKWAEHMSRMLQVSIVVYMVGGAFLSLAYFDLPYHFVVSIVATKMIVDRELKKLAEERGQVDVLPAWRKRTV
ncbi:putative O-glycosylation ligase, exosortase A system-associated [Thalassotalea montiporae]